MTIARSEFAKHKHNDLAKHSPLRYKAFDNPATRYYFVPVGKDGLPLIINTNE